MLSVCFIYQIDRPLLYGIFFKKYMSQFNVILVLQVPVILFPVDFDSNSNAPTSKRSIAIRTFVTSDFMTGVPAVPGQLMPVEALNKMVQGISQVPGISRVVYDLTSKPPGTTEWE